MSLLTRNDGGGGIKSCSGSGSGNGIGSSSGGSDSLTAREGVALGDELQNGDNGDSRELEPGEVVTPPHQHQQQGNESPAVKKLLAKDVMNKALRKLTQIDTDNSTEQNARAHLELEAVRRKEMTSKSASDKPTQPHALENGSAMTTDVADDSEGLYSDTDSSTDEQKDVEDVQKARKEKQAEAAAAAAAPPPQPAPHHGFIPLRFHMRPPCFDFSRMGFMPRMPRGGMRGMRPPFFNRPPVSNRCTAPPPSSAAASACNGPPGPASNSAGAYGPALPPGQSQHQGQGAKRPRSDMLWTVSQPRLPFVFNLVSECGNPQHRDCKQKETPKDKSNEKNEKHAREMPKDQKEKQQKRSNDKSNTSKERPMERSKDKQREQKRERSKEQPKERRDVSKHRANSREQKKPRSMERREHDKEKVREQLERTKSKPAQRSMERSKDLDRSKEQSREHDRFKDRRNEKPFRSQLSKDKSRERDRSSHNRSSRSKSRKTEIKARTPPPPAAPPQQLQLQQPLPAVQDAPKEEQLQQLTPPPASTETRKAFDIFAESPPRLNKTKSPGTATATTRKQTPPGRSTTPPLDNRHVGKPASATPEPVKTTTPQLKIHSEIHSRIGALLEDNDLNDLEQWLRKSHEHRSKKESHIKQEPVDVPSSNRSSKSSSEQRMTPPPRHANPFKRETVLPEATSRLESSRHSMQRNGDRHSSYRNSSRERDSKSLKERGIKQEKNRSSTPPLLTARQIKVERNLTPPPRDILLEREVELERKRERDREREREKEVPVRNGAVAANAPPPLPLPMAIIKADEHSPDTDDYIDNWENDDSMAGGDSSTPKNAGNAVVARLNGDDDDSNTLWNAKSTPPPKAKLQTGTELGSGGGATAAAAAAPVPDKELINIHDLYEKFMTSIKMGGGSSEDAATAAAKSSPGEEGVGGAADEANTTISSLSNSTADESSSDTDATSSSSTSSSSSGESDSSSDEDEDDDEDEEEDDDEAEEQEAEQASDGKEQKQLLSMDIDQSQSQSQSCTGNAEEPLSHTKKNNISKDLRNLQSLEDNLARIQLMRKNLDSGDDICEELLKMESNFIMLRNAIMNKYRKSEVKASGEEEQLHQQTQSLPVPASPVNNIFDANREAIKLTISPLKLAARKPAIFDKDEPDATPLPQPAVDPKLAKPHKEIAIVKPTIMDTRSKPPHRAQQLHPHPHPQNSLKRSRTRERSRSRSLSRNRFRRNMRASRSKDPTRSPTPRRRRPLTSPPLRRGRFPKPGRMGSSQSRSSSRSRTRSRSPQRRRRIKPVMGRRRSSLSPPPAKMLGPRSPPPPSRRRSYSRDRCYSRSPLPFKPPSPPMRRSWSRSRSRSPPRRHSRSMDPRSRSTSRSSRSQSFSDYFVENQSMEAAAYYYNMSLMQQDASGENYDSYAAYMDTAYNMEQAYAQYSGEYSGSNTAAVAPMNFEYNQLPGSQVESLAMPVLRELPMAPVTTMPVAVQKGNVLEIVPSMEATVEPLAIVPPVVPEEPLEDNSKPRRKRVNFVDKVLPTYESDSEDRKFVVGQVEHKVLCNQRLASINLGRQQNAYDQLILLPPPGAPLGPKPANVGKAVLVKKSPVMIYFHYNAAKDAIVMTRDRVLRPVQPLHFDPKYMAMLVKSGRLPMPAFMRHRPPPPPAQAEAMLQEFFTRHPPPPLHHMMPHYLRGPPPTMTPPVVTTAPPSVPISITSQPIPVLGAQNYGCYPAPALTPVPAAVVAPAPVPLPVPLPLPVAMPLPVPVRNVSSPLTSTPTPSLATPFFTPPPLPTLSSHFKVQPVATMREIMPVDILQRIGPLPKTLDLDGGSSGLDEPNSDLTDAATVSPVAADAPDILRHTTPSQLLES